MQWLTLTSIGSPAACGKTKNDKQERLDEHRRAYRMSRPELQITFKDLQDKDPHL
jgi:hypothetical protein